MSNGQPDQRQQDPSTFELAVELDEAIDQGDAERIEALGQELYRTSGGEAGAGSPD